VAHLDVQGARMEGATLVVRFAPPTTPAGSTEPAR
jgi:hypothetical protein